MSDGRQDLSRSSLLTTKLQVPHVRSDLVVRRHLIERLTRAVSRRVTLVSAPAGFGKTTLLSQWIHETRPRVAWVSLDDGDDDPMRFWTYVIAALQTLEAGLGAEALAMLRALQTPRVPIESVLTSLINDIDASAASDKIVLILDDCHLVTTKATVDALGFLINRQPQRLHIIISSRADPVLPLARLRACDQLSEVRAADLRFAHDEARHFFNDMIGLTLSAEQIAVLEQSSEGWIAGMKLAALSMQGRSDISDFVNSFAGSNRYILDYLVEEVLRQQPEAVQSFLLQTSTLDRLTGSLCDALTLRDDGQTMLEQLEKANLFITAMDDNRQWYRYHHLFAEFLRYHLRRHRADLVPVLHCRASEWFERNGLTAEAIGCAMAAGDMERAAALIEATAVTRLVSGDSALLLRWLEALPAAMVRSRPMLCLFSAWAYALRGRASQAEERLSALERQVGTTLSDDGFILGNIFAIRGTLACIGQDSSRTLELSHRALELLPTSALAVRGSALLDAASAHLIEGNITEASRAFAEAFPVTQAGGNSMGSVLAKGGLVTTQVMQGRLREAVETFDRLLQLKVAPNAAMSPYVGPASMDMGRLWYEWDDLEAARRYATSGLEFGQRWGRPACVVSGRILLATLANAEGNWEKAKEELQTARELLSEQAMPRLVSLIEACHLRLLTSRGDLEAAGRLVKERGLRVEDNPGYLNEAEYVAMAWLSVVLAVNRHNAASLQQVVSLLDRMRHGTEAAGRTYTMIEMLSVRSLALCAMGDLTRATIGIQHGLALAEPEGYIRTFVDLGAPMLSLLRHAASRGVSLDYVATLVEAFERDARRRKTDAAGAADLRSAPAWSPNVVEPLSERELEVLRLVAEGLSNQEIADRLILAVGTVKRHVNNIFGKLGATSRLQAVSRARELSLL